MPQNYRSHELHEKKYLARGVVTKINLLSVKIYRIRPPHPIHHSGTTLCMYYRIYFYNIHQKEEKHYSQKTELSSH